ncbi:hypothetical protein PALB_23400 [Pseudoalteromonas luteoviolacea B = ATCC 29581]|nr:hypothetical protein PALB_23400 [Pseudoalteromonas luteoviolacea B = ATCC 29581]
MRVRFIFAPLMSLLFLSACQSPMTPELKQCAQQQYQCEQSCSATSTNATMAQDLCINQCIDEMNACKAQADALNQVK